MSRRTELPCARVLKDQRKRMHQGGEAGGAVRDRWHKEISLSRQKEKEEERPVAAVTSAAVAIPFKKRPDTLLFACVNIRASERTNVCALSLSRPSSLSDAKETDATDHVLFLAAFSEFSCFSTWRGNRGRQQQRGSFRERSRAPLRHETPCFCRDITTKFSSAALFPFFPPRARERHLSYPSMALFGARGAIGK